MAVDNLPEGLETFEGVWIDNAEATLAFLSIQTQWRITAFAMGGMRRTGLDYSAARDGLELAGFDVTPDLWAGILIIEAGALDAQSED